MYEKFAELLCQKGITPYRVFKETGVSQTTLSDWKKGKSVPKIDKLQKIADYLEVPVGYFLNDGGQKEAPPALTKKDEKAPAPADLDENIKKYLLLNAEGKKKAGERIDELLELPKYRNSTPAPRNAHTEEQIAAALKQITEDPSDVGSLRFNPSQSKK